MTEDNSGNLDHEAETIDTPSAVVPEGSDEATLRASVPKKIGHYTIKSFIGSGGMALVYLAVQEQPERKVALKLMKTDSLRVRRYVVSSLNRRRLGDCGTRGFARFMKRGCISKSRCRLVVRGSRISPWSTFRMRN